MPAELWRDVLLRTGPAALLDVSPAFAQLAEAETSKATERCFGPSRDSELYCAQAALSVDCRFACRALVERMRVAAFDRSVVAEILRLRHDDVTVLGGRDASDLDMQLRVFGLRTDFFFASPEEAQEEGLLSPSAFRVAVEIGFGDASVAVRAERAVTLRYAEGGGIALESAVPQEPEAAFPHPSLDGGVTIRDDWGHIAAKVVKLARSRPPTGAAREKASWRSGSTASRWPHSRTKERR